MEKTDTALRTMLTPAMKAEYKAFCAARGQGMSERVRMLILNDMAGEDAGKRFDSIMASAATKNEASGLKTPSVEEINAFVDGVRAERIGDALVL